MRLKESLKDIRLSGLCDFNSIIVRLKALVEKDCLYLYHQFQFNYCAIKSTAGDYNRLVDYNFNSIIVRLKERKYGDDMDKYAISIQLLCD